MGASSKRGISAASLLLAIGMMQLGCKREPVPEYFGIYFESSQGLLEIPVQGDPAYNAAQAKLRAAIATRNPAVIKPALDVFWDSCKSSPVRPVFILYHETVKPQMLHLQHGATKTDVDLGVTPVADKKFMYRITPKQPLPKDLYLLVGSAEFITNTLGCFLVGTRDEINKNTSANGRQ